MSYLVAAALLGIAVLVHEWGHFVAAKWMKIPIRTFSVGFGPKIWGRRFRGTEYRLSLIPFGGYVLPEVEDPDEFFAVPPLRRVVMAAGGPLASALLPIACFGLFNCLKSGFSWYNLLLLPWRQGGHMAGVMIAAVPELFSHSDNLVGVVGIVAQGGQFVAGGTWNWLLFLALMSINFFILNLIPIPVLDGGKILLYGLELVHPAFSRLHYPLAIAGWVLIVGLTGYALVLDLSRYLA